MRSLAAFTGTVLVVGLALVAVPAARAANLCVGSDPGCFSTLQAAVDSASDGDVISIGPGTYAGGVTIDVSVDLVGAGPDQTVISGGGPVLTIGAYLADTEPTVSIENLTITGGVTTSSPISMDWVGADNVIALGGGIEISPGSGYSTGATVSIENSVITDNVAAPTDTLRIGPWCPHGRCPFAWARGGGIDNWGDLTVANSTVSHNTAAGVASDANGGGINTWFTGSLALIQTDVTHNRALASVPNGRFAEGGGIFTEGAQLSIEGGSVSDNTAELTSTLPYKVPGRDPLDMNANGGGIHVGDGSTVTVENTRLSGNRVVLDDPNGQPYAFDAAINPGVGSLLLRNTAITDNHVVARVGSSTDAGPSGSVIDLDGTSILQNVRITGNTTRVTSESGEADATAAGVYAGETQMEPIVISNSVISGNTTTAASVTGSATVEGGGLVNDGVLRLENDRIENNLARATGPAGYAEGGGIWNGSLLNPPPIELTMENTSVTGNVLSGSAAVDLLGSGIFSQFAFVGSHNRIRGNDPEPQCVGC